MMEFEYPEGATPLDPDETNGLRLAAHKNPNRNPNRNLNLLPQKGLRL
jgi:hypothetical protein